MYLCKITNVTKLTPAHTVNEWRSQRFQQSKHIFNSGTIEMHTVQGIYIMTKRLYYDLTPWWFRLVSVEVIVQLWTYSYGSVANYSIGRIVSTCMAKQLEQWPVDLERSRHNCLWHSRCVAIYIYFSACETFLYLCAELDSHNGNNIHSRKQTPQPKPNWIEPESPVTFWPRSSSPGSTCRQAIAFAWFLSWTPFGRVYYPCRCYQDRFISALTSWQNKRKDCSRLHSIPRLSQYQHSVSQKYSALAFSLC